MDLQPLAVQIAKLRFFISLAIEQQPNADRTQNYGIAPLPNLETRFVAADALRGLGGLHRELVSPAAAQGQRRLAENRERHFHAANRRDKLACRREDARLRRQLAAQLRKVGLPAGPRRPHRPLGSLQSERRRRLVRLRLYVRRGGRL